MHKLEELRDMLMDEIEECTEKGISTGSLDVIDKLTHAVKSIDTIIAMEDAGYSNDDYSYARGRGRYAKRDSMGRYSSMRGRSNDGRMMYDGGSYENEGGSYRGGSYRGGSYRYSRDDAKSELASQLRDIAMDTDDPEAKQMIHKWLKQVEE